MRVLLAIDGSLCSNAAVLEVAHCQLPVGSEVKVLTVLYSRIPGSIPDPAFVLMAGYAQEMHEQGIHAPVLLDTAAQEISQAQPAVVVTTKTAQGPPTASILEEAEAWGAHRIVLGSHSRGTIGRAVLGSTASGVAADAHCSVCIIRPAESEAERA